MELKNGLPTFYAASPADWRAWLERYHATEKAVWLILYKKASGVPTLSWSEAVDEALCFGWIDSVVNKRDEQSRYQYFTPRKANSNWSAINKAKVEKLVAEGRMTPAGMAMVELAKRTGTWSASDEIDQLKIPDDLQAAFDANAVAFEHWQAFPRSVKRGLLGWISAAKRPETRAKRVAEVVEKATRNERANQL
jgi:uncharacterized protein YdeI (YjbR/CyaY-like superfamily)